MSANVGVMSYDKSCNYDTRDKKLNAYVFDMRILSRIFQTEVHLLSLLHSEVERLLSYLDVSYRPERVRRHCCR